VLITGVSVANATIYNSTYTTTQPVTQTPNEAQTNMQGASLFDSKVTAGVLNDIVNSSMDSSFGGQPTSICLSSLYTEMNKLSTLTGIGSQIAKASSSSTTGKNPRDLFKKMIAVVKYMRDSKDPKYFMKNLHSAIDFMKSNTFACTTDGANVASIRNKLNGIFCAAATVLKLYSNTGSKYIERSILRDTLEFLYNAYYAIQSSDGERKAPYYSLGTMTDLDSAVSRGYIVTPTAVNTIQMQQQQSVYQQQPVYQQQYSQVPTSYAMPLQQQPVTSNIDMNNLNLSTSRRR
jgi:hypothetical protein